MATKAGRKTLAALRELVDAAESGKPLDQQFTVRTYVINAEPPVRDGPAVRVLRDSYGMSRGVFADFLCVSPESVRPWEQGRREPCPIARRLLGGLAASPEHFRSRFARLAIVRIINGS